MKKTILFAAALTLSACEQETSAPEQGFQGEKPPFGIAMATPVGKLDVKEDTGNGWFVLNSVPFPYYLANKYSARASKSAGDCQIVAEGDPINDEEKGLERWLTARAEIGTSYGDQGTAMFIGFESWSVEKDPLLKKHNIQQIAVTGAATRSSTQPGSVWYPLEITVFFENRDECND